MHCPPKNPYPPILMKTLITAGMIALMAMFAIPATASAEHDRRYYSRCGICHQPIYSYRVFAGYNSYRQPVYRWVVRSHNHRTPRAGIYLRFGGGEEHNHRGRGHEYSRGRGHEHHEHKESRGSRGHGEREEHRGHRHR